MADISAINEVVSTDIASINSIPAANISSISGIDLVLFDPDSVRGVILGGYTGADSNIIDYITISTAATALDFGDLIQVIRDNGALSNGVNGRGISAGGVFSTTVYSGIEYITIQSASNSTLFGSLTEAKYGLKGTSNGPNERGIFFGGNTSGTSTIIPSNVIEYITVNSPGASTDFGDLLSARWSSGSTSNSVNERGVSGGGRTGTSSLISDVEYVTINTPGNSTNYGALSGIRLSLTGVSNGTEERGVWMGGGASTGGTLNTIEYFTINTSGTVTDFGDLTFVSQTNQTGMTNSIRGVCCLYSSPNAYTNYITISTTSNASGFGALSVDRYIMAATSDFA